MLMIAPQGVEIEEKLLWKNAEIRYLSFSHDPFSLSLNLNLCMYCSTIRIIICVTITLIWPLKKNFIDSNLTVKNHHYYKQPFFMCRYQMKFFNWEKYWRQISFSSCAVSLLAFVIFTWCILSPLQHQLLASIFHLRIRRISRQWHFCLDTFLAHIKS